MATGAGFLILNRVPGKAKQILLVPVAEAQLAATTVRREILALREQRFNDLVQDEKTRRRNWNRRLYVRLWMGLFDESEADADVREAVSATPAAVEDALQRETLLGGAREIAASDRILASIDQTTQCDVAVALSDWTLVSNALASGASSR